MKHESKSAPFRTLVLIFFSIVVSGCADIRLPLWLTREPDLQLLEKQRAIPREQGVAAQNLEARDSLAWPLLSQVPDRPLDIQLPKDREAQVQEMKDDKAQAEGLKTKLEQDEIVLEEVNRLLLLDKEVPAGLVRN